MLPIYIIDFTNLPLYQTRSRSEATSASQSALLASLGMRQSPRGDNATEPTLGPSGIAERLNCWLKKRR